MRERAHIEMLIFHFNGAHTQRPIALQLVFLNYRSVYSLSVRDRIFNESPLILLLSIQ